MYTILQETSNKIVIPYSGVDYDFILIVFSYKCYESVGIFENTAPSGCDYEIIVNEVGPDGTVDPENGQIKISPRSTWDMSVYGQDNNTNLFPEYAVLIDEFKAQVKGETCRVYPNENPNIDCAPATAVLLNTEGTEISSNSIDSGASENITAPDATAVVKDTEGNTLATESIPSNTSQDIIVNVGGTEVLYTYPYGSLNTGSTVSYATGDDKDIRDTVYAPEIASWDTSLAWSFPVLDPNDITLLLKGSNPDGSGNNIFGNKERWTDENGLQVFGNDYLIDHLTGLAWYIINGTVRGNIGTEPTWIDGVASALAFTLLGKSDWHMCNSNEYSTTNGIGDPNLGYFNQARDGSAFGVYTSTTVANNSSEYLRHLPFLDKRILARTKSASDAVIVCRKAFQYNAVTKEMDLI